MKHGDMYTAKDGQELMVVSSPDSWCRPPSSLPCVFVDSCSYNDKAAWPCKGNSIILVNKEKYLEYKLLGTAESSS